MSEFGNVEVVLAGVVTHFSFTCCKMDRTSPSTVIPSALKCSDVSPDRLRSVMRFLNRVSAYVAASLSGIPASLRTVVHESSSCSRSAILKCRPGVWEGMDHT